MEGWSADSCKNFFGEIIVSDARAFQSTLKTQVCDLTSSNFNLRVRHMYLTCATSLDLYYDEINTELIIFKFSYLCCCNGQVQKPI